jgi:REP element-mobilizing transposase RayT
MFHRKNNRLGTKKLYQKNNCYFVTICVQHRKCIFETLHSDNSNNGDTEVASTTNIVVSSLIQVANFYYDIELLDWVIMPNHLHFVVQFKQKPSAPNSGKLNKSTPQQSNGVLLQLQTRLLKKSFCFGWFLCV